MVEHARDSKFGVATRIAVTVVLSALFLVLPFHLSSHADDTAGEREKEKHIVVVLTGDITWKDVYSHRDSAFSQLASHAEVANLLMPTGTVPSLCPYNVWFYLSAGKKTPVASSDSGCFDVPLEAGQPLPDHDVYREVFHRTPQMVTPGFLASTLNNSHTKIAAIGAGAGVVLADENFIVPASYEVAPSDDAELATLVAHAASESQVTVVDADRRTAQLRRPNHESTEGNIKRVDAIVNNLPNDVRVLVISANPGPYYENYETSGVTGVIVSADMNNLSSRNPQPSLLETAGVHHAGVVTMQSIDAMLLDWLNIPIPDDLASSTVVNHQYTCDNEPDCLAVVDDLANKERHMEMSYFYRGIVQHDHQTLFYIFIFLTAIMLTSVVYRKTLRHAAISWLWQWAALALSSVPLASLIVNGLHWWDSMRPVMTVTIEMCALSSVIAAFALLAGRRYVHGPMVIVASVTAFVYLFDVVAGTQLVDDSFFGHAVMLQARFYGIGNTPFAHISVGLLMFTAYLGVFLMKKHPSRYFTNPWFAVTLVGTIGLVAIVIEGAPQFGADFGGLITLLPVLAIELFLIGRFRLSFGKVLTVLALVGGLVAGVSIIDWMRPASSRTHLGGLVQHILDGTAWSQLIFPKLQVALNVLMYNSKSHYVILVSLVFIIFVLGYGLWGKTRTHEKRTLVPWVWLAPSVADNREALVYRSEPLRISLISIGITCVLGSLLNDSGILIMSHALLFFVPLLVVTVLRDLQARNTFSSLQVNNSVNSNA